MFVYQNTTPLILFVVHSVLLVVHPLPFLPCSSGNFLVRGSLVILNPFSFWKHPGRGNWKKPVLYSSDVFESPSLSRSRFSVCFPSCSMFLSPYGLLCSNYWKHWKRKFSYKEGNPQFVQLNTRRASIEVNLWELMQNQCSVDTKGTPDPLLKNLVVKRFYFKAVF